jgi:hypothetical protein
MMEGLETAAAGEKEGVDVSGKVSTWKEAGCGKHVANCRIR